MRRAAQRSGAASPEEEALHVREIAEHAPEDEHLPEVVRPALSSLDPPCEGRRFPAAARRRAVFAGRLSAEAQSLSVVSSPALPFPHAAVSTALANFE